MNLLIPVVTPILYHGLDVLALNVALSISPAMSDHFLITFEACPCTGDTNVLSSHHISLAIRATLTVNSVLVSLLDSVAPVSTKTRRPHKSTPWFTDETPDLKKASRKIKRAW